MPIALPWRRPRVPVIELHGILAAREGALNIAAVRPLIERAFRAQRRGGHVVLDINSPGGSAVQSDLIAGLIRRRAESAGVSVHAVIGDVGASGGYWLACAADRILANPMSIVGSIGVVGGGFGFVELMHRLGIERRAYVAGKNKLRLDPFRPERAEDVAFTEALLADIHTRFKAWVRLRRGTRLAADEEKWADGSFMLAAQAQELGLIDGFADVESLVEELAGPRARALRLRPRRRWFLRRLPRVLAEAILDAAEINSLGLTLR
ncbi:MAG: S49 family peptidase [Acidobacteriia bacterium]|nr:S49 family peptidase [Methyloceanibacter sp.]MCL6493113.1 S49 family peptidase [Terriglobia bacterium]